MLISILEFRKDVEFFYYPEVVPSDLPEEVTEYLNHIRSDVELDPVNLIGYLQTMQLALLSG